MADETVATLRIFPTSPRWTPSGLIAIKVRSVDMFSSRIDELLVSREKYEFEYRQNLCRRDEEDFQSSYVFLILERGWSAHGGGSADWSTTRFPTYAALFRLPSKTQLNRFVVRKSSKFARTSTKINLKIKIWQRNPARYLLLVRQYDSHHLVALLGILLFTNA